MHRAMSMRMAPCPCSPWLLLRRLPCHRHIGQALASTAAFRSPPTSQQGTLPNNVSATRTGHTATARGICSTAPVWKGRRGGASALILKRSRPLRRKAPGEGKKKKPKVHGAPMSRINENRRLEEESKKQLEALMALPPEEQARIQKLTEDFLNAPLGQQDVGLNAYLRQKDPDEIMLNLGMALSGDAAGGAALLASGSPSEKPLVPEGAPATCNGRDSTNSLIETPLSDISKPYYEPGSSGLPMVSLPEHAGSANDFNFLIRTLAAHGRCQEARARVVPEMRRRGVRLDGRTYSALLAGTAIDRNSAAAEEVWLEMLKDGIKPEEHAWASRVNAHASAGRVKRALALGKQMREAGHPWCVVTYTSLIAGCTRKRDYQGAWRLWKDMIIWGVKPDVMAYTSMMKLCADTRQYEMAMTFLSDMDMEDQRPSRVTMETLMKAAATAPQWIRAYGTIVDDLVQRFIGLGLKPEQGTYRALMLAYGSGGDADRVLQCIEEAHRLEGHVVDLLGDGSPKLPWKTYCSALDAIAKCCSVGRHRGTRPRWGILPGQDALVMDVSSLQVPEQDADRVRQMQMSSMEWDEAGEAALKKGFRKGKRSKFMGVSTPKDLVGNDEHEMDLEDEYERVMEQAKDTKMKEERERMIQLGFDADGEEKVAKTRPRILPNPDDEERIQAPLPPWVDSHLAPTVPGTEERLEGAESAPLGIGDGLKQREDVDKIDWEGRGRGDELEEGAWNDEEWGEGVGGANEGVRSDVDGDWAEEGEEWGSELESSWSDDNRDGEEVAGGDVSRDTASRFGLNKDGTRGTGGALGRVSMLDFLEGNRFRGEEEEEDEEEEEQGERGEPKDGLVFPPNMEEIMEEMRMLAQEDLDRKKRRHSHLPDDEQEDDEDDEEEEEEDGEGDWQAGEDWQDEEDAWEDGAGENRMVAKVEEADPEVQARAALDEMMAESLASRGGQVDNEAVSSSTSYDGPTAFSDRAAGSLLLDQLERQAGVLDEEEGDEGEEEYEYEDWTPLMHEGLRERTLALFGVVETLVPDAMEAARRADADSGYGGGGPAGPAVQATLRARLRILTESRRCARAIKFVEEEYPKQGARLDNDAALQIVEMYINTRGVGLAEAFESKCRKDYGLPPDRRILGAILNARARRGVAWNHEIPHVARLLDTLQQHRIKPHENELRFVRQLVDKGKLNHSWLPADPNANIKKLRLAVKKSRPVSKSYFKVVSKVKNAKYMIGSGRGKSGVE